jgi:pyruvyl transferase EpsO
MTPSHAPSTADALVARLADAVDTCLAGAVPDGPVALVDFPDHSNVGDSAIWLGETDWLAARGRTAGYSAGLSDVRADDLAAKVPEGPILIHGGGNFGTVWPKHEELRLHLLERFRGRPVVQLPQSIHYADPASRDRMARAIAAHGRFTLLVRDAPSLALANAHFDCDVRLCPDAALFLGRQPRGRARVDVFALMRTDHERAITARAGVGVAIADWLDEPGRSRALIRARIKLARLGARDPQARRWTRQALLARWRLRRGLRLLSTGKAVVTDRLHAHILSLLLDIPHVVLDNSYGKVGGFVDAWTADYRGLQRATDFQDACSRAHLLATGVPA